MVSKKRKIITTFLIFQYIFSLLCCLNLLKADLNSQATIMTDVVNATDTNILGNKALIQNSPLDQSSKLNYIIQLCSKASKKIYLPSGNYILNTDINILENTQIFGDLNLPTIVQCKKNIMSFFKKDNYSIVSNVNISNLFFNNMGIKCKLTNNVNILNNVFFNPYSEYIINMQTCQNTNISNNIFLRDHHHALPSTSNRAIYIGGFATSVRYEYMKDCTINDNVFGIKLSQLNSIKDFSNPSLNLTIQKLQDNITSLKLKENEQNYFSTGINSYNNLKNTLIKNNLFYQMYENENIFDVIGDHAIYLRGAQDIQVIGNHLRGLQNGPYGGFKFKSGKNITIMNNYLRNTGIIMYETPEYGLADDFKEGKKAELKNWLVANNIFDFKKWQGNYSIGIEYNKHTGINNVKNGVFINNQFINYQNIPSKYRRDLLITNSSGEGFKAENTFVFNNLRDDTDDKILSVEFWDKDEYNKMPSKWNTLIDPDLYEKYKDEYIPIKDIL